MRVFNLTDVSTPTLRANGLVNTSITIGGVTIAPGKDGLVRHVAPADQRLFYLGAVSHTQPLPYLRARAAKPVAAPGLEPRAQPVDQVQVAAPDPVASGEVETVIPEALDSQAGRRRKKRRDWDPDA
jgi:hypothetical protein